MFDVFTDPYAMVDKKPDAEQVPSWGDVLETFYSKREENLVQNSALLHSFSDGSVAVYCDDYPVLFYDAGDDKFYRIAEAHAYIKGWADDVEKRRGIESKIIPVEEMRMLLSGLEMSGVFREMANGDRACKAEGSA
jgi:hypothetical protein